MNKKNIVKLSESQRKKLRDVGKTGKAAAYEIRHANILLKVDQSDGAPAWTDTKVAEAFSCSSSTVANVRRRFATDGFDAALGRQNQGVGRPRTLDGDAEAKLTMIACSTPPEGQERWTMRLLADKMVELEIVESCSRMAIQRTMKKTNLSLGETCRG